MRITEHRDRARGLADLLLYDALIEDGILLQQDGSLMAAWSYRGPDTMSASAAEMEALSARFNSVLRLGSGWMVQCDAIRLTTLYRGILRRQRPAGSHRLGGQRIATRANPPTRPPMNKVMTPGCRF